MHYKANSIRRIYSSFHRIVVLIGVFALLGTQCKTVAKVPVSDHQMVVCAHPEAARAGFEILEKGGNAFDAAVAVQFALAVVYPRAGNIGGGGFAVFEDARGKSGVLDFREMAPLNAFARMYFSETSFINYKASLEGAFASGIPGTVDGMWQLHLKKGKLPWKDLIQPAINLAEKGVKLTNAEAAHLNQYSSWIDSISQFPTAYGQKKWRPGDLLIQADLAATLTAIRDHGREGFYSGKVATQISATMNTLRGLIREDDLKSYKSEWREPLVGIYKGYTIITMPPPSAGGTMLLQMLFGAEYLKLDQWPLNSTNYLHYLIEIQRRTFADRAVYFGDPDYVTIPMNKLLSPLTLEEKFKRITPHATPSDSIRPATRGAIESFETTHFSIIDRYGNAIAVTTTLNGNYGSGVVVKGAGFLLNNEMNDFTVAPGKPNQFGMIGGEPNIIAPGKRMLSNMTPTIVMDGRKILAVLGTPGGSTIPTVVMQAIMDIVSYHMGMQAAVMAPKIHSQWMPDEAYFEQKINPEVVDSLRKLGHNMIYQPLGKLECILVHPDGMMEGGTDPGKGDGTIMGK